MTATDKQALLPIPFQCIWCTQTPPQVTFSTPSHALPAATGNADEVLPPGVVCDTCNRNWRKIEHVLMEYPLFKIGAWATRSTNVYTGNPFCPELRDDSGVVIPLPPLNIMQGFKVRVQGGAGLLRFEVTSSGATGIITYHYNPRKLAMLSRAVHKLAFEGLAWGMYVPNDQTPPGVVLDPLSSQFDHVRAWAKRGEPQGSVRPFFQPAKFTSTAAVPETHFGLTADTREGEMIIRYNDGTSWYGVTLLSPPERALQDLEDWGARVSLDRIMVVEDRFRILEYPRTPASIP